MFKKKIVHISLTPIAGAPIRLVNALNKYSDFEARLINLNPNHYGHRSFEEDLSWFKDKDQCLDVIKKADIIHLHNYFNYTDSGNQFGFNLKEVAKENAVFIRQYHSVPGLINAKDDFLPTLVIPHNASRYYPLAKIVPNIIPENDINHLNIDKNNKRPLVIYTPSSKNSAFFSLYSRWDTKSYPEVLKIVKQAQKVVDFDFRVVTNTPHEECLKLKQQADIVIDDVATGSMHLSALEGLSQGAVVLSYLDNTVYNNFLNLTGSKELPVVNVRLKEMKQALIDLVKDKDLRKDLSDYSRYWIENYYSEEKMIKHYIKAYDELMSTGEIKVESKFPLAEGFIREQVPEYSWSMLEKSYVFRYIWGSIKKSIILFVKKNKTLFVLAKGLKKCLKK